MRLPIFLFILLFHLVSSYAQQGEITTAKITFEFPSKKVKGSIEGFASESRIDWDTPSNSILKGSVDASTLDTNNGLRNWSLRSSRYFNVKTHPKITFVSRKVSKKETKWIVEGDLTIKGTTKPFQIEFKEEKNKLIGSGSLYSSDFDIKIKKKRLDNLVNVRFELELVR